MSTKSSTSDEIKSKSRKSITESINRVEIKDESKEKKVDDDLSEFSEEKTDDGDEEAGFHTTARDKAKRTTKGIRKQVAKIIGVEDTDGWIIVDAVEEDNIYMVHYTERADMKVYGHLRGTLVDIEYKTIVSESFGYTPIATMPKLRIAKGLIKGTDNDGNKFAFDEEKTKIKFGFEGVIIRVFRHRGKTYFASHRRLNTEKSFWGKSKKFMEIYRDLGAPSADQLFPPGCNFSQWCYVFLLVDPKLLVATRQNVGDGYVVLLGVRSMWALPRKKHFKALKTEEDLGWSPYPEKLVGTPHLEHNQLKTVTSVPKKKGDIYDPKFLSIKDANDHLENGFYGSFACENKDIRLKLGEFIVLYNMGKDGRIKNLLKIQCPAYEWRCTMRGNDPNIRHRFYQISTDNRMFTNTEKLLDEFIEKYPLVIPMEEDELKEIFVGDSPGVNLAEVDERPLNLSKIQKLQMIWLNYIIALPQQQRSEAFGLITIVKDELKELADWISGLQLLYYKKKELKRYEKSKEEDLTDGKKKKKVIESSDDEEEEEDSNEIKPPKNVEDIMRRATARAKIEVKRNPRVKSRMEDQIPFEIYYILDNKTNGAERYALIREMKRYKKLEALKEQADEMKEDEEMKK